MNRKSTLLLLVMLILPLDVLMSGAKPSVASGAPAPQAAQPALTVASVMDREISAIEKQILDVADAMPEDKLNFSPESLKIPGSEYKGVRTFAGQVKHVAVANYFFWAPLTGDTVPPEWEKENAPENLKSKTEIIQF